MTIRLKTRCQLHEIRDTDWYLEAYMRCATRIHKEERKPKGPNLPHLQRRLQTLYDRIVADLGLDEDRTRKARIAATAINHAVTDHHLPREMCRPYEKMGKQAS